jgi:hypothetical protein
MFGNKKTKIYAATFIQYTNCMHDTVATNSESIKDEKYLDVTDGPILIREEDIEFYKQFGNGFDTLKFVGYLVEKEDD